MLFSSAEFLLFFLPLSLLAVSIARLGGRRATLLVALLFSGYFYANFHAPYLLLLFISITINYFGARSACQRRSKRGLAALILFNLALLATFKYADFTTRTVSALTNIALPAMDVALPLAISFFTFQQIAYLVDLFHNDTRRGTYLEYSVFVVLFPQLIAGPIVRHQYVADTLHRVGLRPTLDNLGWGLSLFAMGLAKKVLLADPLAAIADPIFALNADGLTLSATSAWCGLLAYALQIYFDFSAYSDMAIGIGAMLGLRLPINFLSPYQASGIIDFWRRWHITLSEFLRDYLYVPLGGNRRGGLRRYANLMIVMLLGGLWHGADWAFVLWGGIHGLLLCLNHAYRFAATRLTGLPLGSIATFLGPPLTFIAVVLAWVPFRANGLQWIDYYAALSGGEWQAPAVTDVLSLTFGLLLVWCCPNSMQIFGHTDHRHAMVPYTGKLGWRPSWIWVIVSSALLLTALVSALGGDPNEFIYFQF